MGEVKRSASVLYNEIYEALKLIEQSADRAAEKIVINRKDYVAMLVDTMGAPTVTQDITRKIRGVQVEVTEQEEEFIIEECWVMKSLATEDEIEPTELNKAESEQLDLFSLR